MRKKSILLLEIFIWIILLGVLIFLGINIIKQKMDNRPTYQVMFKDVDSLLLGAPVRVMGIDVGYVTEIKPTANVVYVTFVITNNQLQVPNGSKVSIQFTGLAGSKSIEIMPPESEIKDDLSLIVTEPIRVNSLMQIQTEISESILNSSKNAIKMFGKGGVDIMKSNIKKVRLASTDTINGTRNIKATIQDTNQRMLTGAEYAKSILNTQNENIDSIYSMFSDQAIDQKIKGYVLSLCNTAQNTSETFDKKRLQNIRKELNSNLYGVKRNIVDLNVKVKDIKTKSDNFVTNSSIIDKMFNDFKRTLDSMNKTFSPESINKLRSKSTEIKEKSEEINKTI
ncbi:MAG: hypothetical protein ACD_20C00399G0005 [uncultured bacterium]|nr:MAG: hypothetical protein ACD_20C00399G0005 [uncultured bacterium]HBH19315.1 hypothetical protein [Cyanobacteria bacterium UBA9579]